MEDGGNAGGGMTVVQASHSSSESISQLGMEHGVVVVATRTRRARLSIVLLLISDQGLSRSSSSGSVGIVRRCSCYYHWTDQIRNFQRA